MIEGQEDVTWEDWVALADACERSGIEALFRSDHYVSVIGRGRARRARRLGDDQRARRADHDAAARARWSRRRASATRRCWPSSSTTADHVSGGRDRARPRHRLVGDRAHRLRLPVPVHEGADGRARGAARDHPRRPLERRARSASRASTTSSRTCSARPLPVQRPHPPLIMGGAAGPRAARLAARYADEYNTVMPTLEEIARAQGEHRRGVREGRPRADPVHGHDRLRDRRRPGRVRARAAALEAWTGRSRTPTRGSSARSSRSRRGCAEYEAAGVSRRLPPAPRAPRHRDGRADRARAGA